MAAYLARERSRQNREKALANDLILEIELDGESSQEILTSFDKISGNAKLINKSSPSRVIELQDVKIWLEGTATARFKSKNADGKPEDRIQHVRFLPDPDEAKEVSQLTCDIIRRDDSNEKKMLSPGTHSYPFELQLDGEILPRSFQTSFARIQYRIILHIQLIWGTHLKIAKSLLMTTKGCYNLWLDPNLRSPLVVTKKKEKFFSSRPILSATMVLAQRGYIPGETIEFQLDVENLNGQHINRLTMSLTQKMSYFAQRTTKRTTMEVLDGKEFSCETKDDKIQWADELQIPRNLMATFSKSKNQSVEILYLAQFTVDIEQQPNLKGEGMVVIGTTREPDPQMELVRRTRSCQLDSRKGTGSDHGGDQIDDGVQPPHYSAILSRHSSVLTLPPPYEEIFGNCDEPWDDDG